MPVAALAAFVLLSGSAPACFSPAGSSPVFDFETDFDAASRLYDGGNAKGALVKMQQISKKYPEEYKTARMYHVEVALAANEPQGRVFVKGLMMGAISRDYLSLAGIAPAVEHLKSAQPATWTLALNAAKMAAKINPKSAEAQESIGIASLGLKQKPAAKAALDRAVALAKKDKNPDAAYIKWLVERRTTLALKRPF